MVLEGKVEVGPLGNTSVIYNHLEQEVGEPACRRVVEEGRGQWHQMPQDHQGGSGGTSPGFSDDDDECLLQLVHFSRMLHETAGSQWVRNKCEARSGGRECSQLQRA